ncbi:MAG: tRNA (uridine(34)/cytosine(34)/5-carboxymethylaminomethyluridine(34)-2'-O)-methyltransferase TrmL [Clostridium sp.]|jgi:tRNA (cytidine/uridine-2'-O-)-methyltransferase|nr:tRNA (uridine(34)/cytosine(34)/5-carboxymethylaminomethyluridine(34)-2'-O)-methyltransferase TrmL [Clostridium sp.]
MNIVLVEPEIPQNAGNIARTCAATGTNLHMVKPLGFSVDDKYLKRAGLDYWEQVNISYYDSFKQLIEKHSDGVFFYATTKAVNSYADVSYPENAFIVFGKETAGLPEEILFNNKDRCIRIPMKEGARSLNLSNSVAIILYEALKQNNFNSLNLKGKLTQYTW